MAAVLASSLAAQEAELEWFDAERDDVTLWHTQSELRAEELADHAQGAYDLVSDLLDTSTSQALNVVVWPPDADADDPALLPEGLDETSLVEHVMRNSSGSVRSAVTDALVNAASAPHVEQTPLWLRFGLRFWSQGPLPGFYLRRAGSVVVLDHEDYYSLEQLQVVPQTWQFQAKYFGQSGGMLSWMLQDWGPEALRQLFELVSQGAPFYRAFAQVYDIEEDKLIGEFTKNAERALLLNWPYIEPQGKPFYERLNVGYVLAIFAGVPLLVLGFFIGKRLFYD